MRAAQIQSLRANLFWEYIFIPETLFASVVAAAALCLTLIRARRTGTARNVRRRTC